MTIREYARPETAEEAWQLCQKRQNVVMAGNMWLRMQRRAVGTAIDLSGLGLDFVRERDGGFELGAMATLRELETHPGLEAAYAGAFARALSPIVGVQFRNTATVGGSVFARFGFSDVATLLLALDARVRLYKGGEMPLEAFQRAPFARDILLSVFVPGGAQGVGYHALRRSATDFPVLAVAAAQTAGGLRVAVGARPARAQLLCAQEREWGDARRAELLQGMAFGSNMRATADYRRAIADVLVRRAVRDAMEGKQDAD